MSEKDNLQNEGNVQKDAEAIIDVLKRMQVKLDSMEEKLETLLRQSKEKTFKGKEFSRPRKEYDRMKRPGARTYERKKDEPASEGKFYHGRPFGKKKTTGKGSSKKMYKKT